MFQDLPIQVRDDLLRFYLELDENLSLEDSLNLVLRAFRQSLGQGHYLVVQVPTGQSWLALGSQGQHYQGSQPCPPDWGADPGSEPILLRSLTSPQHPQGREGFLKLYRALPLPGEPLQDLLFTLWTRVTQQVIDRHYKQELHHSYLALVEASVDAIITIDCLGIVQLFNPGASHLFGYSPEEVIGRSVNCLMPPPYAGEHDGYLQNYLSSGEKKIIGIGRRVPARRKDGSIFPAHLAVTEYERNGSRFFIGTLRDLSEFVEARSRATVEERKHLSRELHDSVSQALFGIVLGALSIKKALGPQESVSEAVDYVLQLAESGLAEMRTLIFELRPESLESEGLVACLGKQTQALAKRYQIEVVMQTDQKEPSLELPVKHEVYRVIMESLHNVVKHARASRCTVELQPLPGEYQVVIADNGKGFDPKSVSPNRVGLASMRERVAQLGGRIAIESTSGTGTRISVHFPAQAG